MEHNVLLIFSTRSLVLGLYIVVNLCFTARCVYRFSTTSLKNSKPLLETISSGVPNQVKIRSYRNRVTSYFTEDFKARTSTNFVRQSVAITMNRCPLLFIGNGPIKSIPHFSKGPKGGMGCKKPFTVDLCA